MNWEMMAAWLRGEWLSIDHDAHPLHRGLAEGRSETADILAQCPREWTAEQKLGRLYEHLSTTFMRTSSAEEDHDDE